MDKQLTAKLLLVLKKNSGATLDTEKLLQLTFGKDDVETTRKKTAENNPKKNNKKKKRSTVITPHQRQSFLAVIESLKLFGLLKRKNDQITVKNNFSVTGKLTVIKTGNAFLDGDFPESIFIPESARNGAANYDIVTVSISRITDRGFEGRVEKIVKPFQTQFGALVLKEQDKGYLIQLIDLPEKPYGFIARAPKLKYEQFVIVETTNKTVEKYVEVKINPKAARHRGPKDRKTSKNARELKKIGVFNYISSAGNENSGILDFQRVVTKYNLPKPYDQELIPGVEKLENMFLEELKNPNRKDLRQLYSCTIDGATAKDFDDAISVQANKNEIILYVHIADVSFFIKENSKLEEQAILRGNSYYLGDQVIPMLPAILSEDFCSLRPHTDRLAFTCEMHYDFNLELKSFQFYKSIIHLFDRFTYDEAQDAIDQNNPLFIEYKNLAEGLLKKRTAAGRIELDLAEPQFMIGSDSNLKSFDKQRLFSHQLIEEFMLSANQCAAKFLKQKNLAAPFRVHEKIPDANLENLNNFLKLIGINSRIDGVDQKQIQKILSAIKASPEAALFNNVMLRSFSQAYYDTKPAGHWALAFDDYCHFTSPIRRIADLFVHRQINSLISKNQLPVKAARLDEVCKEASRLERIAADAERLMQKLKSLRYMQDKVGSSFSAVISGFNNSGIFISLTETHIEGFIPEISEEGNLRLEQIDNFRTVIGRYSRMVTLGGKIDVELTNCSWNQIQLDFKILKIN